ncbi:Eukaryotic translation initiation factor 3 subunit E [Wickerhamiella sorbophila]|uniref:Eukaryotic translation initiation factor 3 subunit E n=1 Tax=Wickerhamiella sorbophila TaxID=45607 RepID=A0A2T0FML9_9ASCO|nr:Eukaryotic translation initiation factor 3 subunit E [Wickerhamiella sorbophila]PRT56232.1 Eukaryotic translation initiation factor 3 subunit E [Wickerhamiella sorbophila]
MSENFKYDLTESMLPFLDRQLAHLLLESAAKNGSTDAGRIDAQVLEGTLLISAISAAGGDVAKAEAAKKDAEAKAASGDDSVRAKFAYDSGDYSKALELLSSVSTPQAAWGKLAAGIMNGDFATAMDSLQKVQEGLDAKGTDALHQLNNRAWFVHWALFVLFRVDGGVDKLCELFFQSNYMSTIQASCPWILRYLAVAALISAAANNNHHHAHRRIKELVRAVVQELYEYEDPVLSFIKALYVDYDLSEATRQLQQAQELVAGDYFVNGHTAAFVNAARLLIVELYCRVHQCVKVESLAKVVNMPEAECEKWLYSLVKDNKIDGKVDEAAKVVKLNSKRQSAYDQIIDKTKNLDQRNAQLLAQVHAKHEA